MKNVILLSFFICSLICTSIFAQSTSTWTGAVSTDWATAGNWSPTGVQQAVQQ